jgi:hypothetical protein
MRAGVYRIREIQVAMDHISRGRLVCSMKASVLGGSALSLHAAGFAIPPTDGGEPE